MGVEARVGVGLGSGLAVDGGGCWGGEFEADRCLSGRRCLVLRPLARDREREGDRVRRRVLRCPSVLVGLSSDLALLRSRRLR